jgi:hypothetical protein
MAAMSAPRRYLTHDCDQRRVELVVQAMPNGDWYVSIVREGQKFNRLMPTPAEDEAGELPPPAVVRVTTHGERRQHSRVAAAIANLYAALGADSGADE